MTIDSQNKQNKAKICLYRVAANSFQGGVSFLNGDSQRIQFEKGVENDKNSAENLVVALATPQVEQPGPNRRQLTIHVRQSFDQQVILALMEWITVDSYLMRSRAPQLQKWARAEISITSPLLSSPLAARPWGDV